VLIFGGLVMSVFHRFLIVLAMVCLSACSSTHKTNTAYLNTPLNTTVLKLPKEYANVKPDYPAPPLPKVDAKQPSILPPGSFIERYQARLHRHK